MKMSKRPFPLPTIYNYEKRNDPTPDERPPASSRKQNQLLLETILREFDIPKIYWRGVNRQGGIEYEMVGGQQRIRIIWECCKNDSSWLATPMSYAAKNVVGIKYDHLTVRRRTADV